MTRALFALGTLILGTAAIVGVGLAATRAVERALGRALSAARTRGGSASEHASDVHNDAIEGQTTWPHEEVRA
jgi:hypothetical protein